MFYLGEESYSERVEKAILPPYQSPAVIGGAVIGALVAKNRLRGVGIGLGIGLVLYALGATALRVMARRADAAQKVN